MTVNNVSLGGVTHMQAVQALKDAGQHVTLVGVYIVRLCICIGKIFEKVWVTKEAKSILYLFSHIVKAPLTIYDMYCFRLFIMSLYEL